MKKWLIHLPFKKWWRKRGNYEKKKGTESWRGNSF
jgi:hypothetical protein